jgi:hypothetical protein
MHFSLSDRDIITQGRGKPRDTEIQIQIQRDKKAELDRNTRKQ